MMQPHPSSLVFSPLTPANIEDVRLLCTDCFPLNYPDSWFTFVTSNKVVSKSTKNSHRMINTTLLSVGIFSWCLFARGSTGGNGGG